MEWKKRGSVNLLILNQLCLDLITCTFISVVYILLSQNIYLSDGSWGYWLCATVFNEVFVWLGLNGSATGIVLVAFERLFKIVYHIQYKKYFSCRHLILLGS